MRKFASVAVGLSLMTAPALAQTPIQPGLWEVTDKTSLEGVQPMPATSKQVCVKGGEAILERLLYPPPEEFAKHGCSFTPGPRQPGVFKAATACPATDEIAGVTANAEVTYKPDSYEGVGQLVVKDKKGTTVKGNSVLTGRRLGNC
ncbi:MAG: DUF3617 family protein [Reyranellaceae bacterium]